jgi:PAN domain
MRNFGTVFLLAMSMLGSVGIADAVKAQGSFEIDVDRNGSNYKSPFAVSTPEECRQLCAGEEQCVAWTHVRAGIQGAQARCWLKNATPEPTAHPCCVSGVMSGDNEGQPVELSWIMRNQRQLVLEMTIGGKKIISGGNRLSTKAGVPLISKCGD